MESTMALSHGHLPTTDTATLVNNTSSASPLYGRTENNNVMSATQVENPGQMVRACGGCGGLIADRFLLKALDRFWHTQCLKCSCCHVNLGEIGHSCFTKHGMILCKADYIKMFGTTGTCSGCAQQIPADEMVMRTQTSVYHLKCFTCVQCSSQLNPGDKYSLINGSLFCEHEFPKLFGAGAGPNAQVSCAPVTNSRGRAKKGAAAEARAAAAAAAANNYPLPVC